ncbi:MAG TPA: alpha/beta hydrolase [Nocardioidaceae bacterium]|nr:alpha/beta hydrolase [Nocardioidaceae bacterium]
MSATSELDRELRERLLADLPLVERRATVAGVSTAFLESGTGPTIVLLHGPGEFGASWLPVLPQLARTHRVIAPDLPGHGASQTAVDELTGRRVLDWLGELIEHTSDDPPVVVGRVVGGAIGARFAIDRPERLAHLVLVDSLGLALFEPDSRFALAMHRFLGRPDRLNYERFMEFCTYDLDGAQTRMGSRWSWYAGYAVELIRSAQVQAAMGWMLAEFGTPLSPEELDRITVPTTLMWGHDDLATPVAVARATADRQGWPLHVIDEAGDDPPLDQPATFLDELHAALGATLVTPGREA